jgi:hypothetical protein
MKKLNLINRKDETLYEIEQEGMRRSHRPRLNTADCIKGNPVNL